MVPQGTLSHVYLSALWLIIYKGMFVYCYRSLRGTQPSTQNGISLGQSHYNFQSDDTVSHFGISRFFSAKVIAVSAFAAVFCVITALVTLSGYLVTCNELHYETRRQVLGRNTLGKILFCFGAQFL